MSRRPKTDLHLIRQLLLEARPFWWHLLAVLLISLLSAPLALLTPLPLKLAVDHVLGATPVSSGPLAWMPTAWLGDPAALLIVAASLVIVAAVLQNLEGYLSWFLQLFVGEKLTLGFKARLLAHVQRLSLLYHDQRGPGDSLYRIQYDAPSIQFILVQGLVPLIASAATVIAMLWVMIQISWPLALVAAAIFPLLVVTSRYYRRSVRTGWDEVKRHESNTVAALQETLGALRVVKAFGQEHREEKRFLGHAGHGLREHLRVVKLESYFGLLIAFIVGAGTALVLYIGVRQVQGGAMTLGSLLLVMGYLAQLYKPIETVTKKIATLQSALAGAQRAFAVLDEASDVPEPRAPRRLERARGEFEFEGVAAAYDEGRRVLSGVNFFIPAGSRVGISGQTGAGKTTLVNLLPRFYDPVAGRILLDGTDLRDYRVTDLRRQFAIVLQEPVLFSTTLSENIAYGRSDATEAEIEAAAEAANALTFIRALPQGFRTRVGERGMMLSGGERQRISLARAFLRDAPIVILDEPTSSVDRESEAAILQAMERLMAGRTTFMIAHRIETLAACDVRLFVQQGHVRCEGRSPLTALQLRE